MGDKIKNPIFGPNFLQFFLQILQISN